MWMLCDTIIGQFVGRKSVLAQAVEFTCRQTRRSLFHSHALSFIPQKVFIHTYSWRQFEGNELNFSLPQIQNSVFRISAYGDNNLITLQAVYDLIKNHNFQREIDSVANQCIYSIMYNSFQILLDKKLMSETHVRERSFEVSQS